jgi:hypothetical protein
MNNELTFHESCRNEATFPILCGKTSAQTRTKTIGACLGLIFIVVIVILMIKRFRKS